MTNPRSRRGLARIAAVLLAVAAATVLVLAPGCREDDDELTIAFLADFSGPLAEFGPEIQTGVELAIQHVNDAGGVNGGHIILVTGDTQVDPAIGVEEARRLVEVEGVHAIVGPLSSSVTIAVAESVTGEAGIPTISPSATSPSVTVAQDNGFLFRSTISDAAQAPVLAELVSRIGVTNVAVLYLNDAYGQGLAEGFEASYGGTATLVSHEDGQPSYLAELEQAAGGGATHLVAISFPAQAKVYIREALENEHLPSRFVFVDGTKSQELIDEIGAEFLEGSPGTAPASPDTEASAAWDAAYVQAYGAPPTLPFVREAYDATIALALAAEAAGSFEGAAIRDALVEVASPGGLTVLPGPEGIRAGLEAVRDGDDVNYEGAATTLDWNADGDVDERLRGHLAIPRRHHRGADGRALPPPVGRRVAPALGESRAGRLAARPSSRREAPRRAPPPDGAQVAAHRLLLGQQSLRSQQQEGHDHQPDQHLPELEDPRSERVGEILLDQRDPEPDESHRERAQHRPPVVAAPADDEHRPDQEREEVVEGIRGDRAGAVRPDRAGERHHHPAEHEALHPVAGRPLAHRPGRLLVLPDGAQHAAPGRGRRTVDDHVDREQRQRRERE